MSLCVEYGEVACVSVCQVWGGSVCLCEYGEVACVSVCMGR